MMLLPRSRTLTASFVGLFMMLLTVPFLTLPSPSHALESMSKSELSQVSGQEGLTIDINLDVSMESLELTDPDGLGSSSQAGVLRFNNVQLSGLSELTNLTVDADNQRGVVIGMPEGKTTLTIDDIDFGNNTNRLGSLELTKLDLTPGNKQSSLALKGTDGMNEGLEIRPKIHLKTKRIQLKDNDGWQSSIDYGGNSGILRLKGMTLDITSSSDPSQAGLIETQLDETKGVVLQVSDLNLRKLNFDQVYLGNTSIDGSSSAHPDAPHVSVRNLHLGGSTISVSGQ